MTPPEQMMRVKGLLPQMTNPVYVMPETVQDQYGRVYQLTAPAPRHPNAYPAPQGLMARHESVQVKNHALPGQPFFQPLQPPHPMSQMQSPETTQTEYYRNPQATQKGKGQLPVQAAGQIVNKNSSGKGKGIAASAPSPEKGPGKGAGHQMMQRAQQWCEQMEHPHKENQKPAELLNQLRTGALREQCGDKEPPRTAHMPMAQPPIHNPANPRDWGTNVPPPQSQERGKAQHHFAEPAHKQGARDTPTMSPNTRYGKGQSAPKPSPPPLPQPAKMVVGPEPIPKYGKEKRRYLQDLHKAEINKDRVRVNISSRTREDSQKSTHLSMDTAWDKRYTSQGKDCPPVKPNKPQEIDEDSSQSSYDMRAGISTEPHDPSKWRQMLVRKQRMAEEKLPRDREYRKRLRETDEESENSPMNTTSMQPDEDSGCKPGDMTDQHDTSFSRPRQPTKEQTMGQSPEATPTVREPVTPILEVGNEAQIANPPQRMEMD